MAEGQNAKEMGVFERIIGIFISPKPTFESIDRKPTWLVPLLISIVIALVLMYLTNDINIKDQLAQIERMDLPAEQLEAAKARTEGPWQYLGLAIIPVATLAVLAILSAIFMFTGNTIMGGKGTFKKTFSVIAWSGLVGTVGTILNRILVLIKGTNRGVGINLSALLPLPELGKKPSVLYALLSKLDLFMVWELVLWIIGFAVVFRFTTKKSATMVILLWVIWIAVSVLLAQVIPGPFGS